MASTAGTRCNNKSLPVAQRSGGRNLEAATISAKVADLAVPEADPRNFLRSLDRAPVLLAAAGVDVLDLLSVVSTWVVGERAPPKRCSRRQRADWRGGRGVVVVVVISGGGVMVFVGVLVAYVAVVVCAVIEGKGEEGR